MLGRRGGSHCSRDSLARHRRSGLRGTCRFLNGCDAPKEAPQEIRPGDDPTLLTPHEDHVVVNNIIARPLRCDGHATDYLAKPGLHIPYNNWPVPIRVRAALQLVEQRIAQKIMRIENENRLAFEIGDDHPFLDRKSVV